MTGQTPVSRAPRPPTAARRRDPRTAGRDESAHAEAEHVVKRILLIQDDPGQAASATTFLQSTSPDAYAVEWTRLGSAAIARLIEDQSASERAKPRIDAVVFDLTLPNGTGIETFERLFRAAPHIPILVVCDAQDEQAAQTAMRLGAQDYLLKDRMDAYTLPKVVHGMIERAVNTESLFELQELARVTLKSIGDAVISTDVENRVMFLNPVAEKLTGWSAAAARGLPLERVFRIVDSTTRMESPNPMAIAIKEDHAVALAANCILICRDGREYAIEDSAAPIHDRQGVVKGAVMVFHDVSEARALTLRMSYEAQHDSLTDLPNRALMTERLTQALAFADRNRHKIAVLFLDIDRFKSVNDSLGHETGDLLLQSVALRLAHCVRNTDTISRHGGDEFVILLAQIAHTGDAAVCAEKILRRLSAPHQIGNHELHITASIGIATSPEDGADARTLLKNSDLAMYHAKGEGRNNYQYFQADMNTRALARRVLERELHHALEHQEFTLFFQPTISLATRAICGVEALIRWRHPTRGLLLPEDFLPLAEELGMIVPIGRWVLRTACVQAKLWQGACIPSLPVAVNVSPVELRDPGFMTGVRGVLAETNLEPANLLLEITETVLVKDTESTAHVLRSLKEVGVKLALDDFGTGFSSLSHLRQFPIDVLKIDQSFMRNLHSQSDDAGIVGAVVGMADSLRMRVVAEGVETEEQISVLEEQCCPEAQGFYFSRPLPAEDFTALLWTAPWHVR